MHKRRRAPDISCMTYSADAGGPLGNVFSPPSTPDERARRLWIRLGDHSIAVHRLIAKNARENGRVTGSPTVRVRPHPSGAFTIFCAEPGWWLVEMHRHPEWGAPQSN